MANNFNDPEMEDPLMAAPYDGWRKESQKFKGYRVVFSGFLIMEEDTETLTKIDPWHFIVDDAAVERE